MPGFVTAYVRWVESVNRWIGRTVMYLVIVSMGLLLLSSISRTFFNTSYIWMVEMLQFILTAYYILGGGYSVQLNSHVRMDLFYSNLSERGKAIADSITSLLVLFYLVVLLLGAISSTIYAFQYGQVNYSAWRPPLWPIKSIMVVGIFLMLLQMLAVFLRDVARARGEDIE